MLTRHDLKYPRTELMIRRSPVHNAMPQDVYVTVNQVQRQGRSTVVRKGIISPTEMDWIVRAMEEANGYAAPPPAQPARRTGRETPSERFEF
jgi:hypothetical protein